MDVRVILRPALEGAAYLDIHRVRAAATNSAGFVCREQHRRGLFEHRDVLKKRLCWGVLSLWLLSLCTSKEKVTRP